MSENGQPGEGRPSELPPDHAPEHPEECHSNSSH
jgi:hypothetical protein